MQLRPRKQQKEETESKTIDINAQMEGSLIFSDPVNLRINGQFKGTLTVRGTLTIGETANVHANINGENIVLAGKVKGDIIADKMLVLMPTAVLRGNIVTPKLNIVEGALFQGHCQMNEGWLNIDEVAKFLEIDLSEIESLANSGRIPGSKQGNIWKFDRDKIEEWAASAKLS